MPDVDANVVGHLPSLRHYSRCLNGSQERGDRYVALCLEAVLEDPSVLAGVDDVRIGLFRAFHDLLASLLVDQDLDGGPSGGLGRLESRIRALPPVDREALLLRTLGSFGIGEIATILRAPAQEVETALERARAELRDQTRTRVIVIEDEPIIAFDLANIVEGMGHTVLGIADTRERAVALARETQPGIVLADIKLRDDSSGIDAADEILRMADIPVIFITAYPERLLTGERREPTYLVTKPFDADALEVMISQALLLHPNRPVAAAG